MESFLHIMKVEVMDEQFKTKDELIQAMTEWIDFYNRRPKSSLIKLSNFKGSLQPRQFLSINIITSTIPLKPAEKASKT
ncbi:IS3 family transposase [Levilactobacillus namurensis]|nr:IS3 family transposase [Levilactobacillus namurensis]MCW3779323.1 IS3 family transposase [Levilactobacillus namurensis]MDT7019872.1 IS3 family transposase [Levilactobacillus namurensis]